MNIDNGMATRPRVIGLSALYLGLAAVFFFLAFCNLDGRLLWGDEAETAVLAKNILKFGVPRVDDGINHVTLHGDNIDARNSVWTWSPWLQEYVTAASFAIFGPTTWAARAPFAFIGWLAVLLLGAVAWKIYRSHRVSIAAMLLLGTSEVFLLHIRQCRYYSITVLAEILLLYGVYQMVSANRAGAWLVLSGLVLQFYCNYTIAAANVPVLMVLAGNLFRQKKNSAWWLLMVLGISLVVCIPWLLYAYAWRQTSAEGHSAWTTAMAFYLTRFQFYFLPWCVLLLPALGWFFGHTSKPEMPGSLRSFDRYLLLWPALYLPVLLVMPGFYLRYLLPVLPLAGLLAAAWLFRFIKWPAVAFIVLILQCTTNLFAVASAPLGRHPLRSPLAGFIHGAMQPYDNRVSDVLAFLKPQMHPRDVLVSWDPELPLVFYTPLKIVDARLYGPPSDRLPDWILPQSACGIIEQPPVPLPPLFKPYYDAIALTVHDSPRDDDIPEPGSYQYQSAKAFSPFVIYRLKKNPAEAAPSVKP